MKRLTPLLIFVSVLMILFFVTTITVLSSYGLPPKKIHFKKSPPAKTNDQNKYAMSGGRVYDEGPEEY